MINQKAKQERLGKIKLNNQGCKMKIVAYRGSHDIDVEFQDEHKYIVKNTFYDSFKKGTIKNPFYKGTFGVGYLGIDTRTKNRQSIYKDKAYITWTNMLNRCYNPQYLETRETYKNKTVCDEWLCFSNFKMWFDKNYYEIDGERMALDKDILVKGNTIYSPNTCVFVPYHINSLFTFCDKRRNLSLGITEETIGNYHRYISTVSVDGKNKSKNFKTFKEAKEDYKIRKEAEIKRVADIYKEKIPQKLYDALYNYKIDMEGDIE